jgi:putative tryptophan/tyrosine transport system substrate-binding protein
MKRRQFIALVGGAVAWPLRGRTQQATLPVAGFLNSASADGYAPMASAFGQGLRETGYVEGHNVQIEYRWADNQYDRLHALAAELVSRRPAVICANNPSIAAVRAAAGTIPIVFMMGDDPVRLGVVASFNRPGGNVTGVTILSGELATKRLALLHELLPSARMIAALIDSNFGPSQRFQVDIQSAAGALGLSIRFLPANNEGEINAAFDGFAEGLIHALLVGPGPFLDSRRDLLVALAAKKPIPAAYETRATVVAGGLTSYGPSVADGYRQAGIYTGRVLNGEKPSDLPVLGPSKYELVINLKTAKALGIAVPATLLTIADEVFE